MSESRGLLHTLLRLWKKSELKTSSSQTTQVFSAHHREEGITSHEQEFFLSLCVLEAESIAHVLSGCVLGMFLQIEFS